MRWLRIIPVAAATMAAAFVSGSLWRAHASAAAVVCAAIGLVFLFMTLTRLQLEQTRRLLEGALAAVGDRIKVFGPVRLNWPGHGRLTVDYLVVGPGQRAWPLLGEPISQWPNPERAAQVLRRRAGQAAAAAEAVRVALREGGLPESVRLSTGAKVQGLVVPLRRRVTPQQMHGVPVCNMEDLEAVLLGRQQFGVAPGPSPA
ncbi:MAG TPA: hypothetical protein VNM16_02730 [Bacillota bacterium]|nr:hypothetical protein [Bacillota bacterium]